ncbi:hypothetical protein GCM10017673_40220 [Streptosporangium violaceochromogenes]|nr:hypothetical protein GCM10017673_40220 [Streptosporangium violaceochromogenes]
MIRPDRRPEQPPVRVGQVWADNDRRSTGRKVRVEEIHGTHAVVVQVDSRGVVDSRMPVRRTRIRLDRFRPTSTGYRLITDAPEVTP